MMRCSERKNSHIQHHHRHTHQQQRYISYVINVGFSSSFVSLCFFLSLFHLFTASNREKRKTKKKSNERENEEEKEKEEIVSKSSSV